jgi:hypothetical protein
VIAGASPFLIGRGPGTKVAYGAMHGIYLHWLASAPSNDDMKASASMSRP